MKKLWMLLAAVGFFAACDDNLGDGQQGANEQEDLIVNVSATSALGYKWQAGDSVKVVYNAEFDKEFALVPGTDATLASFSYDVEEVEGIDLDETVYAVFPATVETELKDVIVGGAIEKKLHMTYSLSAVQDGVIGAEENLSYAVLKAEVLKGGATAAVQFNSPFAVLDVTLPEGVKSVTFTADKINGKALAGDATVQVGADAVASVTAKNTSKTLTLVNAAGLPVKAKVLVLPGNSGSLAVKMDGRDGAMYETLVLENTTLEAGKEYSVNLDGDVFSINYSIDGGDAAALGQTVAVSPLGADLEISIVSLHARQVTVTEEADWIMVVDQTPVRSFHKDAIHLQIDGNASGQERQAEVTVNYGEGQSKTFTVTQGAIDMSIVNDAEGNQIVWEESFGLFNSSDVSHEPTKSFTNKFTISISDDFSKGAYVIRKMFYAESYWDENGQMKTNTGADYYADMEGDKLIVHKRDKGGNSYPFSDNNITLDFNRTDKTFAAGPIALNDGKYIGNYAVKVCVEQPPQQWNQSVGMSWPAPSATMTIAVSGSTVTITDFVTSGTTAVGTLDGNTITIPKATQINSAGPLDSDVILTISEDGKSISAPAFTIAGWVNVSAYSATKQ